MNVSDITSAAGSMFELLGTGMGTIVGLGGFVAVPMGLAVFKRITGTGKGFLFYRSGRRR